MKHVVGLVMVVGLLQIGTTNADAQVRLGPEVVFADHVDFGIGAHGFFPLQSVSPQMEIGAFFDLYFPDAGSYFEVGGTWYYLFPLADNPNIVPKVGAGLTLGFFSYDSESPGIDSSSSSTDVGVHILGGLEFPMPSIRPFVEVGAGLGDIPDFFLRGGVGFNLGGGG